MMAKPAILKDANGHPIHCSNTCCKRLARHTHHIQYHSNGGSDSPDNLAYLCQECHVALHSLSGDFRRWGRMGGQVTASTHKSIPNLKQFQGEQGYQRWLNYCNRKGVEVRS